MFNFLRRSSNDTSVQPTFDPYLAGYREGCPCTGDPLTQAIIDTSSPAFKRGYQEGRQSFESLQTNYPHLIVKGKLREDTGD
jgi:hypothetical protein